METSPTLLRAGRVSIACKQPLYGNWKSSQILGVQIAKSSAPDMELVPLSGFWALIELVDQSTNGLCMILYISGSVAGFDS